MNEIPNESALAATARIASLTAASIIPIAGGPLGVFIAEAYARHKDRKLEAFFQEILQRIAGLEKIQSEEGVQALLSDQNFKSLLYEAAIISEKTLQDKKIALLQNAVVNSRSGNQSLDKRSMFLRYIDELTESHLQLMALLHNPRGFYESNNLEWSDWTIGGKTVLIQSVFPDWDMGFIDQLVKDLNARGLVSLSTIHGISSPHSMADSSSTGLGIEFSRFVERPE